MLANAWVSKERPSPNLSPPGRGTRLDPHAFENLHQTVVQDGGNDGYFQTTTLAARGSDTPQKVRNVIGILRGSDATLKNTFVLVTAHYDHVGRRPDGEGDLIYNGANDDGSGTVGVIELAAALSTLKQRPKRSIVFMTFFGEERGLLGSRYYGANPIFGAANASEAPG